ncbi:MAG: hydroxymethylbilane synthase [Bdellovibrionales bacterium]
MKQILRLGTRGSPLALIQAQIARHAILDAHPEFCAACEIEIVPIRTNGDWTPAQKEKSFLEMGSSKGLFTKEIEEALYSGMIDMAVHSMKDVSVWDPEGLTFIAMLERGDPRDALLSPLAPCVEDLPKGARVGTSSLRRKAQILAMRPDLEVVPLRGNVDTRMKKLMSEEVDATILALAGLQRLGVGDRVASVFSYEQMLPAPAQAVLGVQIRKDDEEMTSWLTPINHEETMLCAKAERALLRTLDGSCHLPIAALAQPDGKGGCSLDGLAATVDGKTVVKKRMTASLQEAETLGKKVGLEIKAELPEGFGTQLGCGLQ